MLPVDPGEDHLKTVGVGSRLGVGEKKEAILGEGEKLGWSRGRNLVSENR